MANILVKNFVFPLSLSRGVFYDFFGINLTNAIIGGSQSVKMFYKNICHNIFYKVAEHTPCLGCIENIVLHTDMLEELAKGEKLQPPLKKSLILLIFVFVVRFGFWCILTYIVKIYAQHFCRVFHSPSSPCLGCFLRFVRTNPKNYIMGARQKVNMLGLC